ncbi:MAG: hypothetical protein JST00_02325 [Deltaproteobacteria bacterium]|nr:hypothetical protein [Deltaproteobacteria bacterium]
MKTPILAVAALLPLTSFLAFGCADPTGDPSTSDEEIRATKTLLCASSADARVYYGSTSQILLEANVSRDGVLANAALTMTRNSDLGVRNETWTAQKRYTPTSERYKGMQKYSSADAWCGYSVIAPPDLNGKAGTFSVYVQQACEGGFLSTVTLSCKVESRRPAGPDGPAAPASVELRFSANGKRDAIASGYYEASAFTGNAIVIGSSTTDIDLDNLVPDGSESAPDGVCYTGDATRAKKILWAMLGNTDGNGDHWLDEGATIAARAGGALRVDYRVTGEGGSTPRSLDVPRCP